MKIKILFLVFCLVVIDVDGQAPLVLQPLDYTENPVDIPNPDRGWYRGRVEGPGAYATWPGPGFKSPEVDHRVPIDASTPLEHGYYDPTIEGDDIEFTHPSNTTKGGALPSVSFMTFNLNLYSSNAVLGYDEREKLQTALNTLPRLSESGGRTIFDLSKITASMFYDGDKPLTGKTQPITEYGLNYIRGLLQKVRDGNAVAFLKFSYDGDGFNYHMENFDNFSGYGGNWPCEPSWESPINPSGMCNVPGHEDKDWIEYHIWQLTPIFHEFEDVITCVKTGMLGTWGEMHATPMAQSQEAVKKMMDAYLEAVPASRILLAYSGAIMAWYNATYGTAYNYDNIHEIPIPQRGTPESRMGVFSDSYGASYDNGGQSGKGRILLANSGIDPGTFDRYKTLTWLNNLNTMTQGEGSIGDHDFGNMPGAIIEANEMNLNLLNMRWGGRIGSEAHQIAYQRWERFIYNEANVMRPITFPATAAESNTPGPYTGPTKTAFFDPVYDGRTGLEYIRDRFGYRLVLREAKVSEWVNRNETLRFDGNIQNVGFGNVVNRKNVWIVLKPKDGANTFVALTSLDARDWLKDKDGNSRPDNTAAWRALNFSVNMSAFGNVPAGDYDIYLKINDPKEQSVNRRCIQFANHNIWNVDLGANLIGSTTVR